MEQKTTQRRTLAAHLLKHQTNKLTELADDKSIVKSKSFIHSATDTFHELILLFLGIIVSGGLLYSLFEHQGILKGFWWACVTAFTVGYGDVVPVTLAGRILGIILMSLTVFVIVPLITARIATKMIVNDDAWTDEEQKRLMDCIDRINLYLDEKGAKTVDSGMVVLTKKGVSKMGGKPSKGTPADKRLKGNRPPVMKPVAPVKPKKSK